MGKAFMITKMVKIDTPYRLKYRTVLAPELSFHVNEIKGLL